MIQQTAHLLLLVVASASVDERTFKDVSREYRIETYNTFRQQRAEFDRRQQLGVEATRRWTEGRFDTQLREQIVEWFVESTDATGQGVSLPELPGAPSRAFSKGAAAREDEAQVNTGPSAHATESTSSVERGTRNTSIVIDQGFVDTNEIRDESVTIKVLGSVGRAMAHAFVNRHSLDEAAPSIDRLQGLDVEAPAQEEIE